MTDRQTPQIQVTHSPSLVDLEQQGVFTWPIWTKEISEFPWTYGETETCYLLEGEVVVTPKDGEPVRIKQGDLVIFAEGLSCIWQILQPIKKHYRFGESSCSHH
jgi:uncharacterized cupin superfamily protein